MRVVHGTRPVIRRLRTARPVSWHLRSSLAFLLMCCEFAECETAARALGLQPLPEGPPALARIPACERHLNTHVFVHAGAVDALSAADELPVTSPLGRCVNQAGIPE